MNDQVLGEFMGRVEAKLDAITTSLADGKGKFADQESRLRSVEKKVHTAWLIGGVAGGGVVMLALEKVKKLMGI